MNQLTKIIIAIFVTTNLLASPSLVSAQDMTTKRRPDNAEFVTDTQVRLTTESLTVAEIQEVKGEGSAERPNLWAQIMQSLQDFLATIRDIFN